MRLPLPNNLTMLPSALGAACLFAMEPMTPLAAADAKSQAQRTDSASTKLQVGWATADVTPTKSVNLQGQFHMRIAKGGKDVKDPLTVTALALSAGDGGDNAAIMVSCDTATITTPVLERCRKAVKAKTPDAPADKLFLNATHTHTAPCMIEGLYPPSPKECMTAAEYADFFVERVAEAASAAWRNRKPGGVSWGCGQAVVGHNRRAVYLDDLSKRPGYKYGPGKCTTRFAAMYGKTDDPQFSQIEGPEDPVVNLLFTWDQDKKLTGVVVNLACTAQATESLSAVSADFWHEARATLRKRHGGNLFVLPQCAAAGDQSPKLMLNRQAEEKRLKLKGLTQREDIGLRVATAVDDGLSAAQRTIQDSVPLRHVVKTINLPRRRLGEEELRLAKDYLAKLSEPPPKAMEDSERWLCLARVRSVLDAYEARDREPTLPMEMHVIRVGDVAFVTYGCELFLDYGLQVQKRSPAVQTFGVQLTAGHVYGSYLPTAKAEQGQGYGANLYCNAVGSEGGQALVEEAVRSLKELWAGSKGQK